MPNAAQAAARILLHDWNDGRIPYFTLPPQRDTHGHAAAAVVSALGQEFDVDQVRLLCLYVCVSRHGTLLLSCALLCTLAHESSDPIPMWLVLVIASYDSTPGGFHTAGVQAAPRHLPHSFSCAACCCMATVKDYQAQLSLINPNGPNA